MATMAELYQSVIIEHDRSPRNFHSLATPTHRAEGRNPLCGDEVTVELVLDAEDRIVDAAFQGRGCAVSKAAASMMTVAIKGKTATEVRELADLFQALLTGHHADTERLGRLTVFAGLTAYPMRVKCATMAWHALKEALLTSHSNSNPTTES